MPVLGKKNFDSAVQKVMKESNVDRKSAERIVGSAEKKVRLKMAVSFVGGGLKKRNVPTESEAPTRRENPQTPLGKKVPFGKKPTKATGRRQQIDRMLEENRATLTGDIVTPPPVKRKDFQGIISARQRIAKEHNHMIEFKRHFRGADQFKRASLESQDSKYAHYWLLNARDSNGNGWGVAQQSIAQNIKKFIGKPFVITAQTWIPESEYGNQYEHPYLRTNDLNVIFAHQEKFRVGTINDVKEKNGEYFAQIKMKPKYAGMRLPPFCSPAIFQLDPMEAEGNITKWEALHLAGLIEDPAYGARIAILRGSCMGTEEQCSIQFKTAKTLCPTGQKIAKTLAQRIAALQNFNKLEKPKPLKKLKVTNFNKLEKSKPLKKLKTRLSALHGRIPEPTSKFNKKTPLLKAVPFGQKPTTAEARKDVTSRESIENVRQRNPGIRVTPGAPTQRDRARIIQARISSLHGNTKPQVKKKKVKTNGVKGKTTEISRNR